jgi:hypothetical protein
MRFLDAWAAGECISVDLFHHFCCRLAASHYLFHNTNMRAPPSANVFSTSTSFSTFTSSPALMLSPPSSLLTLYSGYAIPVYIRTKSEESNCLWDENHSFDDEIRDYNLQLQNLMIPTAKKEKNVNDAEVKWIEALISRRTYNSNFFKYSWNYVKYNWNVVTPVLRNSAIALLFWNIGLVSKCVVADPWLYEPGDVLEEFLLEQISVRWTSARRMLRVHLQPEERTLSRANHNGVNVV